MTNDDNQKKPPMTPSEEGAAVFGFDDLQALREEYEERIRVMKAEHDAHIAAGPNAAGPTAAGPDAHPQGDSTALRGEYEERIRVMKAEYEARLKSEGASRQELITDLTFELAAAREEGEMRARTAVADAAAERSAIAGRGVVLESEVRAALEKIARVEAELASLKSALAGALTTSSASTSGSMPSAASPAPASTPPASTASSMSSSAAPSWSAPVSSPPMASAHFSSPPAMAATAGGLGATTHELRVDAADVVSSAPEPSPPPVPSDPTPATTAAGARRKKIRLR